MRFLLIKVPERHEDFRLFNSSKNTLSAYPPLGLEYIAASLENKDQYVEIIDLDAENLSKEKLKNLLLKSDVVGISVFINNYDIVAGLADEIKKIDPQIPIIIGGPHCTFVKKNIFSYIPSADISVESEGESVILDLVRYFEGKAKLSDINGINYKKNGKIFSGKPLKVIEDLDNLPFPARHLTEKYQYGKFDWGLRPKEKVYHNDIFKGMPL